MVDASVEQVIHAALYPYRNQPWLLAFSGGLDSSVLLHVLSAQFPESMQNCTLLYIDHAAAYAHDWVERNRAQAEAYGVSFLSESIAEKCPVGASLEAFWREQRYAILHRVQQLQSAVLLTAQHASDQVETVLLQLFRGAGIAGLSAMPAQCNTAAGIHLRPMLSLSRQQLLVYAQQHHITYIEDPSNTNQRFARNYLRHTVMPLIENRWPQVHKSVLRSAQHCAAAKEQLNRMSQQSLANVMHAERQTILTQRLLTYSHAEQACIMRAWLKLRGVIQHPTKAQLDNLLSQCYAAEDRQVLCAFAQWEVRRYQHELYCLPQQRLQPLCHVDWDLTQQIHLPGCGILTADHCQSAGLKLAGQHLQVRARQGGERIRLYGQAHHRDLKSLYQEWKIPPWQRAAIPLLYEEDELVAIAGYGYAASQRVNVGEWGWNIHWQQDFK